MGPDGIFQFKEPFLFPDRGTAKVNRCLNAQILDFFCADNLFHINPEQLVLFVLQPEPQRPYLPGSAANGYHIPSDHPCILL